VTRSTQACFLAADRQCTELPLLRLPRLVPEARRVSPTSPRTIFSADVDSVLSVEALPGAIRTESAAVAHRVGTFEKCSVF